MAGFRVGNQTFYNAGWPPGGNPGQGIKLIRIIPTRDDVDNAYCTPDRIGEFEAWTEAGERRWKDEVAARKAALIEDKTDAGGTDDEDG